MMPDIYDHLPSWPDFVERVLGVLVLSLEMLHQMNDLPTGEIDINLKLSRCIRRANMLLNEQRRGIPWPPSFDGIQGLTPDDEEPSGSENTRPDCRWGLTDMQEIDPRLHEKYFDIECKRLGLPSSRTWKLNERYILDGVLRFMQEEHFYGRNVDRGAMVGYIQSMEIDEILNEVNNYGRANAVTAIIPSGEWQSDISRLQHTFDRQLERTPFHLEHFWVDLRNHSS